MLTYKLIYSIILIYKKTGISQPKISYYESGKHSPSIEDCIKIANFYGIPLDELVGREIKYKE